MGATKVARRLTQQSRDQTTDIQMEALKQDYSVINNSDDNLTM